jgi:hypothetical protein
LITAELPQPVLGPVLQIILRVPPYCGVSDCVVVAVVVETAVVVAVEVETAVETAVVVAVEVETAVVVAVETAVVVAVVVAVVALVCVTVSVVPPQAGNSNTASRSKDTIVIVQCLAFKLYILLNYLYLNCGWDIIKNHSL